MAHNIYRSTLAFCILSCFSVLLFLPQVWAQTPLSQQQANLPVLDLREIDLNGCVYFRHPHYVIEESARLDSLMGNNRSLKQCRQHRRAIDFAAHTLLGLVLGTDWCRRPGGLTFEALKDASAARYMLVVRYDPPPGQCRALTTYPLWLLVPKLPEGYEVAFDVAARPW